LLFPEVILKITDWVYWDFFSTLLAMFIGIFFTWFFAKHYYSKANEYFRRLNAIYSRTLSEISKNKFEIIHDEKEMPTRIVFVSGKTKVKTSTMAKLNVIKNKATNKDS
jgi:hypothetical protein